MRNEPDALRHITQDLVQLRAERPVRLAPMPVLHDVAWHDHCYYELCIILEGRTRHLDGRGEQLLRAGTVIVMPPGLAHAFRDPVGLKVVNCYYLAEWLLTDLRNLWDEDGLAELFLSAALFRRPELHVPLHLELAPEVFQACRHELNDLEAELKRPRPALAFLKSCFVKFLTRLCRSRYADLPGEQRTFDPRVQAALRSVEEWLQRGETFSLERLSAVAGVSADRFGRIFREATGWAPTDYFQRRRVQWSCSLLLNTRLPVTGIALALNYADAAHFCRLFKRHQKMTPTLYRKRHGAG